MTAAKAAARAPRIRPGHAVSPFSANDAAQTIAPIAASTAIVGIRSEGLLRASIARTTSASSVTRNQVAERKP